MATKEWYESTFAHIPSEEMINELRRRGLCVIVWTKYDVRMIANDEGIKVSDDEAEEILQHLQRSHDAEHGITWEDIRFYVNNI